jgi:hypothetical protein
MKERLSCNGLSQVMKHGCTTMNLQANVKAYSGNTSSPRTKEFKRVSSAGNVMLMLFWDLHGPILERYQDCGQMISSA